MKSNIATTRIITTTICSSNICPVVSSYRGRLFTQFDDELEVTKGRCREGDKKENRSIKEREKKETKHYTLSVITLKPMRQPTKKNWRKNNLMTTQQNSSFFSMLYFNAYSCGRFTSDIVPVFYSRFYISNDFPIVNVFDLLSFSLIPIVIFHYWTNDFSVSISISLLKDRKGRRKVLQFFFSFFLSLPLSLVSCYLILMNNNDNSNKNNHNHNRIDKY